jgi:hypothetical protein
MSRIIRVITRACTIAMPMVFLGCGGLGSTPDTTSSTETGQVKGRVTVGGKPLAKAEVRFNPSNLNRKDAPAVIVPIKADGTYELTTLVGQNQISLAGPGVATIPRLSYYSKPLDVKPGSNEYDIAFPAGIEKEAAAQRRK